MRGAVASELLRSVSGLSVLAVYLVAVLLPAYVLFSDGSRFDAAGLDAGEATLRLMQPLAWAAVSAAFVGAYTVTREYYYGSMDRTLTAMGFRRAFVAKLVAGALIAVALTVCTALCWTVGTFFVLRAQGLVMEMTAPVWGVYGGAAGGAVFGAVMGASIGWISRNYYVTAIVVLGFPMIVEFAVLRTAPEVAKFSPGLAIAALGVPGYQGRLLDLVPALAVTVVWTAGLVAVAWARGRRSVA